MHCEQARPSNQGCAGQSPYLILMSKLALSKREKFTPELPCNSKTLTYAYISKYCLLHLFCVGRNQDTEKTASEVGEGSIPLHLNCWLANSNNYNEILMDSIDLLNDTDLYYC